MSNQSSLCDTPFTSCGSVSSHGLTQLMSQLPTIKTAQQHSSAEISQVSGYKNALILGIYLFSSFTFTVSEYMGAPI